MSRTAKKNTAMEHAGTKIQGEKIGGSLHRHHYKHGNAEQDTRHDLTIPAGMEITAPPCRTSA